MNEKKAASGKDATSKNTQANNSTIPADYDVPAEYCGAWSPIPANELEHCKEAAQRYRHNLQFWLSRFRKIHALIDHHQRSISRLRSDSAMARRNASAYLELQGQAEHRLERLQGVRYG